MRRRTRAKSERTRRRNHSCSGSVETNNPNLYPTTFPSPARRTRPFSRSNADRIRFICSGVVEREKPVQFDRCKGGNKRFHLGHPRPKIQKSAFARSLHPITNLFPLLFPYPSLNSTRRSTRSSPLRAPPSVAPRAWEATRGASWAGSRRPLARPTRPRRRRPILVRAFFLFRFSARNSTADARLELASFC